MSIYIIGALAAIVAYLFGDDDEPAKPKVSKSVSTELGEQKTSQAVPPSGSGPPSIDPSPPPSAALSPSPESLPTKESLASKL